MRLKIAVLLAGACVAWPSLAMAQVVTGDEVTVNPAAAGGSGYLLYPGGTYGRVVPVLRQPGDNGGPIQLHMPARHRVVARAKPKAVEPAAEPDTSFASAEPVPQAAPVPKPKPKPKAKVATAAPTPQPAPQTATPAPADNPYVGNSATSLFGNYSAPAPAASAPPPPKRTARANPAPAQTPSSVSAPTGELPGLTKNHVILFAKGAADPAEGAMAAIRFLANDLNTGMMSPTSRVELYAYGGDKGDKGSDARRLSLKRALAIRQLLIDGGLPSERIDVRAMGGVDDSGPQDRVDVYVKA